MNNILILIKKLRKITGAGIINCKKALIENNYNIQSAIDNMRKLGQIEYKKKSNDICKNGIITAGISQDQKYGALIEINCETDFVAKNNQFLKFSQKILNYTILKKIENIKIIKKKFKQKTTEIFLQTKEKIKIQRFKYLKGDMINYYLHGSKIGVIISTNKTNQNTKHIAMHIAANKPEYFSLKHIPKNIFDHEFNIQLEIAKKNKKNKKFEKKIAYEKTKKILQEISLIHQKFLMNQKETVNEFLIKNKIKIINFFFLELYK